MNCARSCPCRSPPAGGPSTTGRSTPLTLFVKLARTIRPYRVSVEATLKWKLTNGLAKRTNAAIGRLRANAWGVPQSRALHHHDVLDRAGLALSLLCAAGVKWPTREQDRLII